MNEDLEIKQPDSPDSKSAVQSLIDSDFEEPKQLQTEPAKPAPSQATVDEIADAVRAGIESCGFDPSAMTAEAYQQFEELVREQFTDRLRDKAAREFILNHTADYDATPQNYEALRQQLEANGMSGCDVRELEFAYAQAKRSGAIRVAGPKPEPKPMQLGLSDRQGIPYSEVEQQANAADDLRKQLDSLPLDQARQALIAAMRKAGGKGVIERRG